MSVSDKTGVGLTDASRDRLIDQCFESGYRDKR